MSRRVAEQVKSLKDAYAELAADRDYLALTPREQQFIENFLGTVTGDRFADGANFKSDLRSYGFRNVTRLLAVYNRHYPAFAAAAARSEESDGKPQKVTEGRAALMGDLETALEGMLSDLGWKPAVHVDMTREGIRAELEDWADHDPSVGIYGGKEATVIFDYDGEEMTMKWRWEPHVEADRQREVEAHILKHEKELYRLVMNILMGW